MSFGKFIKIKRLDSEITLREASIQLGMEVLRLSQLEREVSSKSPTPEEMAKFKEVYKFDQFKCDNYLFNEANFKEDQRFMDMLKNETPADLLAKHGIIACKLRYP
jgi:transcriptional regulator with XRE-family HTH domain